MAIHVGLKAPKYPAWVDKAYQELSGDDKERIVKADIYINIEPKGEDWQISKMLQQQANRVPILDTLGHCLWALCITAGFLTWFVMQERDEVQFESESDQALTQEAAHDPAALHKKGDE
jgi:hypothetical protein